MTLYINEVEGFWLTVNLATFILTLFALWDAWVAKGIVRRLNGHAREIAAAGNLRREVIRLVVQTLLLFVVIPGLFTDHPTTLSLPLVALIAVPMVLLLGSVYDTIDRRRLIGTVEQALRGESEQSLTRIEVAIAENTELTQQAADHADLAYKEANSVNEKIATQGAAILAQGEDAVVDRERGVRVEEVGKDTNERAIDIQGRMP